MIQMNIQIQNKSTRTNLQNLAQRSLDQLLDRNDLGFFKLPEREENWTLTEQIASKWKEIYDSIVIVGIGGSSLGPKVLSDLFQGVYNKKKIFFCENVDVEDFEYMLLQIPDFKKTGWVFISKSGSTIETLVSANFIVQKIKESIKNSSETEVNSVYQQFLVISEHKSNPLTDWAKSHDIPILEIPVDVGGRFSVLSPVGLFPAAFMGVSLEEIRKGSRQALKAKDGLVEVTAQSLHSFERNEWITVFWFYSSRLRTLGPWIQQLWAESLGKQFNRSGEPAPRASTPLAAVGACDQHSILQQILHGAKDKFVIFTRIRTAESDQTKLSSSEFPSFDFYVGKSMGELLAAEAQATAAALTQEKVSNMTLIFEDASAQSIGYQFMFWELVVGALGEALNINAFDQPAVEIGKKIAREILKS